MSVPVAAVRPDDWNLPLFVHVLGAMLLVGAVLLAALFAIAARRGGDEAGVYRRLTFRTFLLGVLPSYIVMRVGAQWSYSEEGFSGDDDPAWIGVGYITTDAGALLLLIALVLSGIATRRARANPDGGGATLTRVSGVIAWVLLAAYLVAVWAMTVKPT